MCLVGLQSLALGQRYDVEFTGLGDANSINNQGTVAGRKKFSGNGAIYNHAAGLSEIGLLPGASFAYSYSINEGSDVVGLCQTATGESAFFWNGLTMSDLGSFGEYEVVRAKSINDQRTVVGVGTKVNFTKTEAFLWTESSGIQSIIPLTYADQHVDVVAINESGVVAGRITSGSPHSDLPYGAFYWSMSGGHQRIIDDSGRVGQAAVDINDASVVLGNDANPANAGPRAWLWTTHGGFVDIPVLSGFTETYAFAMNNLGHVVGTSIVQGGPNRETRNLFLWKGESISVNLTNLINLPAGFEVIEARDINDLGQIVGIGRYTTNPNSTYAVILNPVPEPTAMIGLGIGLVEFLRRSRRKYWGKAA